jgi:hypothetical protein
MAMPTAALVAFALAVDARRERQVEKPLRSLTVPHALDDWAVFSLSNLNGVSMLATPKGDRDFVLSTPWAQKRNLVVKTRLIVGPR